MSVVVRRLPGETVVAVPDGSWETHHGSRASPVILCTGEPENCHLNCGYDGNFQNPGITPRVHRS